MDEIIAMFLQFNYSKGQIHHRFNALKSFLQAKLFNSNPAGLEISLEDKKWLDSLNPKLISYFNPYNIDIELKVLEQRLHNIKPLTVFLSFQIPDNEVDNLGMYIRQNFKKDAVIEIKFDGNLIGGSALSWNGIYKDYSIHSLIAENEAKLIETFKNYLR